MIQKKYYKMIILVVVFLFILGITYSCLHFLQVLEEEFLPSVDEMIVDSVIPQSVQPNEIDQIYTEVMNGCDGTLLWNLSNGEDVAVNSNNMGMCQSENYYSKLFGYTYDLEEHVVLHVKVLKNVDNQLYRLDDTLVGIYQNELLNDLLDNGTSYEYICKKNGERFELIKVRLIHE